MIKTDSYNNVSDELLATAKLGRNETAIFVNLGNNADPSGIPLYPTQGVSPTDSIYDPYKNEWVEIAYITRAVTKGDKKAIPFGTITFEASTKGLITLSGNKSSDVLLYEYLTLSNHNASNPNRDKAKRPIFERLIAGEKAEKGLREAMTQMQSMEWAFKTPLPQVIAALKGRGIDLSSAQEAIVRAKALEEAKKAPFNGPVAMSSNSLIDELSVLVPECLQAGVIKFDVKEKKLYNIETGTYYDVEVSQTDKMEVKQTKLLEYCKRNLDFAAKLLEEIK
jgi:hypothetical protein